MTCYKSSLFFAIAGSADKPHDEADDSQQRGKPESEPSNAVAEVELSEEITGRFQAARSRSGSENYQMWHPLTIA